MKNIIIDCDPGHDDILAILEALSDDYLNILGYTTVCGNQTLGKVTKNLCNVMTYLNLRPEIASGYDKPLIYDIDPQPLAHGESGLDGPVFKENKVDLVSTDAVDFMYKKILKTDKGVTLVALAPLTNIAMLIEKHPDIITKIDELVIMGGSIYRGNILEEAEFNIYEDPHSAKIVFESDLKICLAPLEVCDYMSISHARMDAFKNMGYVSNLVYKICDFYSRYSKNFNRDMSPVFDLVPIMYLKYPVLFKGKDARIDIVLEGEKRGKTIVDYEANMKNTLVLDWADNEKLEKIFVESIKRLDFKYKECR